jgi:RNA polymerase subunit RPABC4/transcription elongation factor Spt4
LEGFIDWIVEGSWMAIARLFGLLIGGYLLVLWAASILWVYRDIRSRSSDPVSQLIGVAIAVIFPIIGLPIYLVLRPSETLQEAYDRQLEQEAILSELHSISACPECRRPVSEDFMVCAYCSSQLKQPCTSCSHLLQFSWRFCPYCASPQQRREAQPRQDQRLDMDEPAEMDLRGRERERASTERVDGEPSRAARAAASVEVAPEPARASTSLADD